MYLLCFCIILFSKLFNLLHLFINLLFVYLYLFVLLQPKQTKNSFYFATEVKQAGEWVGKILFNNIISKHLLLLLFTYNLFIFINIHSVVFNMEPLLVQPVISSYVLYSSVHIIIK